MKQCEDHTGLEGFSHFTFDPEGSRIVRGHCVYQAPIEAFEKRKPVVVLHEMFGLSQGCVDLCRRLVADGFTVYMPVLFGKPLPRGWVGKASNAAQMCMSREFTLFRLNRGSPVTNWVRSLCNHVAKSHDGTRVGVIGMCLTAHVVFPLTYDTRVDTVVASQSSVPVTLPGVTCLSTERRRKNLAIGDEELVKINATSELAHVYAMRFEHDPISPADRLDAIAQTFPGATIRPVIDPVDGRRPSAFKPHSVLTDDYQGNDADTQRAYDEMVDFLRGTSQ